jgi:hypothetical protein
MCKQNIVFYSVSTDLLLLPTASLWVFSPTFSHLHQSVVSQLGTGDSGGGTQEAGIRHFLHSLSDRQNQSGVHEGHDDVRVVLVCTQTKTPSTLITMTIIIKLLGFKP